MTPPTTPNPTRARQCHHFVQSDENLQCAACGLDHDEHTPDPVDEPTPETNHAKMCSGTTYAGEPCLCVEINFSRALERRAIRAEKDLQTYRGPFNRPEQMALLALYNLFPEIENQYAERLAYHIRDKVAALQSQLREAQALAAAGKRLFEWDYVPWTNAGGVEECQHGRSKGIACPSCDEALLSTQPDKETK